MHRDRAAMLQKIGSECNMFTSSTDDNITFDFDIGYGHSYGDIQRFRCRSGADEIHGFSNANGMSLILIQRGQRVHV
jgi:hypothetical protein